MKKWICTLGLLMTVFLLSPFAAEKRVFDDAGLLTSAQASTMEQDIARYREKSGLDIVFVTTNDVQGKTSEAYADDYYDYNGFGSDAQYSGVLLLIDMENRVIHISTTGKAIGIFTDARIDTMLDHVYDEVSQQEYGDAMQAFLKDVDKYTVIASSNGVTAAFMRLGWGGIGLCALAGLVVGALTVAGVSGRYKMTAREESYAFRNNSDVKLTSQTDQFLHKSMTSHRIQRSQSSGGGSSTHRGSSGRSHGGGSRKF